MSTDNAPRFDFDKPPERKRGAGRGSRFFVLDRTHWEVTCGAATHNQLNLLTAMLVLLAGTGADQQLTKWSTKACEQYTGMGKPRAKRAIEELLKARIISLTPSSTPRFPQYKFAAPNANKEPIFLPMQLVMGFREETPVLKRVRDTTDAVLLRMLIDLYGRTQVDAAYGMPLDVLAKQSDTAEACKKIFETGAHAVWSLAPAVQRSAGEWRRPYLGKNSQEHFWPRLDLLERIGALWFEPWVFASDGTDAEPLFPVGAPDPKGGEFSLTEVALRAAVLLAADRTYLLNPHADSQLVILPAHHAPPLVRGVARMRVEADTPGRRAAYGARAECIRFWHGEYERLFADLKLGRTDRPIRTIAALAKQ